MFETNCMKLGKVMLNTSNVNKNGRRGQPQKGVDVWGYRDRNIQHPVGIQCKLKAFGHDLTDAEVRDEWEKALRFHPPIKEFFILTTAENDEGVEELARDLSLKLFQETGRSVEFYIWGWGRISDEIVDHPELVREFDPDHGTYSREHSQKIDDLAADHSRTDVKIDTILAMMGKQGSVLLGEDFDGTMARSQVDEMLDRQIDEYRSILQDGRPQTALELLVKMLSSVEAHASGRIIFRITANMGACHLALGHRDQGCDLMIAASAHAPEEPKAISNRALALLLRSDFAAVLDVGREHLVLDQADATLWSYVIQAAGLKGYVGDPLELVPERHHGSEDVAVALIHINRIRGNDTWWDLAAYANNLYPENRYARRYCADSVLDQIGRSEQSWTRGTIPTSLKERLSDASDSYAFLWRELTRAERIVDVEDYAVLANWLVSLRLLDRHPEAVKVIEAERPHVERDNDTLLRAVIAAYEGGSRLADDLFPLLEDGPEKAMLRIQLALRKAEWKAVADLDDTVVDAIQASERAVTKTAIDLCRVWVAAEGLPSEGDLEVAVDAAAADPKASILAADLCNAFGFPALADKAWNNGRQGVTTSSHWVVRTSVAKHAYSRGRWREAADLFEGAIDLESDTDELRQYASAVAYEMPQTGRGARFFQKLPAELKKIDVYRFYNTVMLFHAGDMPRAEKEARNLLEDTLRLDAFRLLSMVYWRSDSQKKIKGLANKYDVLGMRGSVSDRLYAARVLHAVWRVPEPLKAVYELYLTHRDRPDVALGFFAMMMEQRTYKHIPRVTAVGLDAWVSTQDENGHVFEFVVGEDVGSSPDVLSLSHPFVRDAMGKAVGESFSRPRDVGGEIVWTIKGLAHRYAHAAQDIGQNFESWFPDESGVYSYTMKENDIQPVLDVVRRQAEQNEQYARQYSEGLPLSLIAAKLGREPISFAEYVRSTGRTISTCIGNDPERARAIDTVLRHRSDGAVLDSYAVWTAAMLGVLPTLKEVFGTLYIGQSVKDDLHKFKGEDEPAGTSFSIVYQDGQYAKHEVTRAQVLERRRFVTAKIQEIDKHCAVAPVAAPPIDGEASVERAETMDMIVANFGPNLLDSAAIAAGGHVLLCEDMTYRQYAGAVWPIRSVWLQPVLACAVSLGLMTLSEYVAKLVSLARLKHGHLSLDDIILLEILRPGTEAALADFAAASEFIGTESADVGSHIMVAVGFIEQVFDLEEVPYPLRLRSISILLEKLIRNQPVLYPKMLVDVLFRCSGKAQQAVAGWIQGHCLVPETEAEYREFCKRYWPHAVRQILRNQSGYIANLQRHRMPRPVRIPPAFLQQTPASIEPPTP
ncbi:PIN domain-containing protein [Rhizobium tumorigenes]|uniref:PIN domain-containing protein n=1 Tax=Rhizobium tumorigenes TaxID=2041385 RepID=UPI00241D2188|nr:hypothetical protein [Rhizobium tumorigenes]WFS02374.1 hypothetical protein PR016_07110 [Rhizobium tumorigenes]